MNEQGSNQTSSRNSGGMIHYEIKGTKAYVEEVIENIERAFHPMGYGTHFSEPKEQDNGTWISSGSRATSCD